MSRRGNNEGSIYKRSNGRWEAKVTVGYKMDGKPIRKSSYHKTRKEAQAEIRRKAELMAKGVSLAQDEKTLREWAEIWQQAKKPEIAATTWENYDHALKIVLPHLGHFKLRELKHLQIQQFIYDNYLREDGKAYSKSTMEKVRCVLHSMLKEAEKNELVFKNVAIGLKLPRGLPVPGERESFTDDEVAVILGADPNIPFLDAAKVLLNTGLREGELMALLPRNINLTTGEIRITNATTRDRGMMLLGPPKTPESVRTIPVKGETLDILRKRMSDPKQYLFSNRKHEIMVQTTFLQHYYKAIEAVGVRRLSPHCCRHTFATRLYRAGVNPLIIQKLMGHTDYALTANLYTHVNTYELKSAISRL